jgi:hypothetical protein
MGWPSGFLYVRNNLVLLTDETLSRFFYVPWFYDHHDLKPYYHGFVTITTSSRIISRRDSRSRYKSGTCPRGPPPFLVHFFFRIPPPAGHGHADTCYIFCAYVHTTVTSCVLDALARTQPAHAYTTRACIWCSTPSMTMHQSALR